LQPANMINVHVTKQIGKVKKMRGCARERSKISGSRMSQKIKYSY
jgi:hypothetical protein